MEKNTLGIKVGEYYKSLAHQSVVAVKGKDDLSIPYGAIVEYKDFTDYHAFVLDVKTGIGYTLLHEQFLFGFEWVDKNEDIETPKEGTRFESLVTQSVESSTKVNDNRIRKGTILTYSFQMNGLSLLRDIENLVNYSVYNEQLGLTFKEVPEEGE